MEKNKYQPYETDIIAENLDEISSHNNLNTEDSAEKNDNFNYESPKKKDPNAENNPLLNVDTTLKSLRISHSNEKSEESQILINRINGIKSPKIKPIQENESDLYFDMYEILNKENDLNKNNLENEHKNKIQTITNNKIRINKNVKSFKSKTNNNSLKSSNYNTFKNSKISISNKLKTKFKKFNTQNLNNKKASYSKQISIQQLFKQQFEERSKNNSQITNKIQQHKYDNYSSPNYFEDSLSKEKTPKNYSTIENSESFRGINLTYIPQCEINLNSIEYMRSLFDDDEENHDNDSDDKNVMVSQLDINLSPSSAKKKIKKPLVKVKKFFSNDGSSIRKYLFKTNNNCNKQLKSISQKNNNIIKYKKEKVIKNNTNHIEATTSSLVGFNNTKNNSTLNKNQIIYKKITRMKTGFSYKINNKTKSNFKNINSSLRNSTKTKTSSREKTECVSNKTDKYKLIKKYFLIHKINSNRSFQTNERLTNPTLNKNKIMQNISNLENTKSNSKIIKKNDIPICFIKKKNKIPIVKNKNQQSKISYLNIVKRMNSINNKNNTKSLRDFYPFINLNNSKNIYENKLNNNSSNKLNKSSLANNNERFITDFNFNQSMVNSKNVNNNIFQRINTIKAMKNINMGNSKISVRKKVLRDLPNKLGSEFLFD